MKVIPISAVPTGNNFRESRKNAELTITVRGIFRNELVEVLTTYSNGYKAKSRADYFNQEKYPIMASLGSLKRMTPSNRTRYFAEKWMEIVIDTVALKNGGSSKTVLDKLIELKPVVPLIQNLVINIQVPITASIMTNYAEYKKSSARKFLLKVVNELRSFNGIKNMNVVLEPSEGLDPSSDAYVLPFCDLETFTDWRLKYQEHGVFSPKPVSRVVQKRIDEKYDAFYQEAGNAKQNAVFTRSSSFSGPPQEWKLAPW